MTLRWVPGYGGAAVSDPDAMAYLRAVEEADNQALEQGVQQAVNQFVIGCKNDGIWDAIKACCILAGARTTNGALVPLVGDAPTPYNFDLVGDTDYDRETGLVGDGSTKYLDSNRNNNADPQNDSHNAVYVMTLVGPSQLIATGTIDDGANNISTAGTRSRSSTFTSASPQTGFIGASRSIPASYSYRDNNTTTSISVASIAPLNANLYVFARNLVGSVDSYSASRIAFYSIGESLDLALLDTRVSNLITAIGAAIP